METSLNFYLFLFLLYNDKCFADADHVLTTRTSFSIFTPWTDPNAVNTILLENPKDKKRSTNSEYFANDEDQIMIRVRIGPSTNVGPVEKYLVINDVYDPKRQTKDKALVPYLIEVMRGEPVITYSLEYIKDVKVDDLGQHLHRNARKKIQKTAARVEGANNSEKEYKPAVERLNTVMKKLSEIFRTESKNTPHATETDTKENSNSKNEKTNIENQKFSKDETFKVSNLTNTKLDTDAQSTKELESSQNKNNEIQHNDEVRLTESSFNNLENTCLKRHVFENWKKNKFFEPQKRPMTTFSKANQLQGNSYKMPIRQDMRNFHSRPLLEQQQRALMSNIRGPGDIFYVKTKNDDEHLMPESNDFLRTNLKPNAYRKLQNLPDQFRDAKKQLQYQRYLNDFKFEQNENNLNENEELLPSRYTRLKPLVQPYRARMPYENENNNNPLYDFNILEQIPEEQPKHKFLYNPFERNGNCENNPLYLPLNSRNIRRKRSTNIQDASHRYYKSEDNNGGGDNQCDRSKMFHDDFDLQACDTCGGKNKKPQKPSHGSLNHQRKRDSTVENRRRDITKTETCHCRTHHSACICGTNKNTRSYHGTTWFSEFSLDSPTSFVTSRIRIFRKRHGVWWQVAPSTNMNGVFSDGNFSFSFSSPIELFQLEKVLRFQEHNLLFPKLNAEDHVEHGVPIRQIEENILASKELNSNPSLVLTVNKKSATHKKSLPELRPITDFGFLPSTMSAVEKCPYNDKRLCLNMLTDEAPASTFKVQMPFQENLLVSKNLIRIQISNIITDATTKDALQLSVLVINKGVQSRLVTLSISNCPTVSDSSLADAKTCVQKILNPNIAETATFLLPLVTPAKTKHKRIECQVEVSTKMTDGVFEKVWRRNRNVDTKVVSVRKFLVEPEKRCLCIWDCNCHCLPKLESHVDYNICQKMSSSDRKQAGFPKDSTGKGGQAGGGGSSKSTGNAFFTFIINAAILLLIMLLLGLLKAVLGLVSPKIDRMGYDYIYPNPNYDNSSRLRRFLGNIFMFTIFPFRFLCTCFTPSPEDLLVASSEWQCCQAQGPNCEDEFDDPRVLLVEHKKTSRHGSKSKERLSSGIEAKQQELSKRLSHLSLAFQQEISDDDEDEISARRVPKSASEIVKTLSERRDQRRKSRHMPSTSAKISKDKMATELVNALLDAKRVYRTLREPIGNVSKIPQGVKYCIQGYFIATMDGAFEFINFQPLVQYRSISSETFLTKELQPPIFLCSGAFNRRYSNEIAVLKSGDISVQPPDGVPCINIRNVDDISDTETSTSSTLDQHELQRHEQRLAQKRYAR